MSELQRDELKNLAQSATLQPKEALLKVNEERSRLSIGIPKENFKFEKRIPLTPNAVKILVGYGFEIKVEKDAGKGAQFSDNDYSEAGAQIISDKREIYSSDIIVKISFPTIQEIKLLKYNQILFSALNLPNLSREQIETLANKKITAFCYEYFSDKKESFPFIQSMSEIAGRAAIFIAAEYLTTDYNNGKILGGITGVEPTEIVVIGAGTVGQYAIKNAVALGASVKLFDESLFRLRRLQNTIGINVFNSTFQSLKFKEAIINADVVIGAIRSDKGRTPIIINKDIVMQMKEGAIIIDVSIDQGGCCETSEVTTIDNPIIIKHGVIHYGVPNIPSKVPKTAASAMSNIFIPILKDLIEFGTFDHVLWEKPSYRNGIYIYKGVLTNHYIGNKFMMNSKSIDLLMTSTL